MPIIKMEVITFTENNIKALLSLTDSLQISHELHEVLQCTVTVLSKIKLVANCPSFRSKT